MELDELSLLGIVVAAVADGSVLPTLVLVPPVVSLDPPAGVAEDPQAMSDSEARTIVRIRRRYPTVIATAIGDNGPVMLRKTALALLGLVAACASPTTVAPRSSNDAAVTPATLAAPSCTCPWDTPDDLLVDRERDTLRAPPTLTVCEAREDLDCLAQIFAKQYVATPVFEAQGISLVERVQALRDRIDGPIAAIDLVPKLGALHEGTLDRHAYYSLRWQGGRDSGGVYAAAPATEIAFVADEPNDRDCPGFVRRPALVGDDARERTIFVGPLPIVDGRAVMHTKCAEGERPLLRFPYHEGSDGPPTATWTKDGILVVTIPTFVLAADSPAHLEVLAAIRDRNPRAIVFDLRGNGGGSDAFAWTIGMELAGKGETLPPMPTRDRNSLYSVASLVNSAAAVAITGYQAELRTCFDGMIASGRTLDDAPTSDPVCPSATDEPTGAVGRRRSRYTGPIVALVDRGCASSCEGMVWVLRAFPNATFVGTHTTGALAFGNLGELVLPHSKITFGAGMRAFELGMRDDEGFPVDHYIVAEHPDRAALALARRLAR